MTSAPVDQYLEDTLTCMGLVPADKFADGLLARLGIAGPNPAAHALIDREVFRVHRMAVKTLRRHGMVRSDAEEVIAQRIDALRHALAVRLLPAEGQA